jgi:hypothetical protein
MADRTVQPTVAPGAETHEGVSLSRPLGRETPRQSASRQDGGETATETVDLKALARLVLARDVRRDSNRDTVSRERRTTETQARQSSSKPVILKPAKTGETAPETPIALAVPSLSEIQSLTGVSLSRGLGVETTETGDTAWTAAEAEHTAITEAQVLAPAPWFERHAPRVPGEPSYDQPCAARRGRVERQAAAHLHFCVICGAWGGFGYGVIGDRPGQWYCREHRPIG